MNRIALGVELWSEEARPLIAAAAKLADQLEAPWIAIAVSDAAHALPRLTDPQRLRVRQNTELVTSLGGTPFFCEGQDVANTLMAAALVHGAQLLVLGKPHRGLVGRLFTRSVAESLMSSAPHMPLMFVGGTLPG